MYTNVALFTSPLYLEGLYKFKTFYYFFCQTNSDAQQTCGQVDSQTGGFR